MCCCTFPQNFAERTRKRAEKIPKVSPQNAEFPRRDLRMRQFERNFQCTTSFPSPCVLSQIDQIFTPSSVTIGSVTCQSSFTSVIVAVRGSRPKNRGPFRERNPSSLSKHPSS